MKYHQVLTTFQKLKIIQYHNTKKGVVVVVIVQSVLITTNVVSLYPIHGEVYSIQHYVIKFVSDLRDVGGFLQVLWLPPPIKLTATI